MTEDELAQVKEVLRGGGTVGWLAARDLVFEVERCWQAMGTLLRERDEARRTLRDIARVATNDTLSDVYVRGYVTEATT